MMDIETFIDELRNTDLYIRHIYTEGGCYKFHILLSKLFRGSKPYISQRKNHSDWSKYIKKLVQNPNMIEDMGERLYESVKDTYHLRTVTKTRHELYQALVK